MRYLLILGLLSLVQLSPSMASTSVLKPLKCWDKDIQILITATHSAGDRYALLEWSVIGSESEIYMSILNYQDRSLHSFSGSTLGSSLVVEGNKAQFRLDQRGDRMEQNYQLSCKVL